MSSRLLVSLFSFHYKVRMSFDITNNIYMNIDPNVKRRQKKRPKNVWLCCFAFAVCLFLLLFSTSSANRSQKRNSAKENRIISYEQVLR